MAFNLPTVPTLEEIERPCGCCFCTREAKAHGRCLCEPCEKKRALLQARLLANDTCAHCGHGRGAHYTFAETTRCGGSTPFQCPCAAFEKL